MRSALCHRMNIQSEKIKNYQISPRNRSNEPATRDQATHPEPNPPGGQPTWRPTHPATGPPATNPPGNPITRQPTSDHHPATLRATNPPGHQPSGHQPSGHQSSESQAAREFVSDETSADQTAVAELTTPVAFDPVFRPYDSRPRLRPRHETPPRLTTPRTILLRRTPAAPSPPSIPLPYPASLPRPTGELRTPLITQSVSPRNTPAQIQVTK